MKKSLLLTLFLIITIPLIVVSQSCLPNGISFYSQAEIDNFKANYPDCIEIEGDVEINGDGITNLDSLHQITSIGEHLEIYDVPNLVSIEGLGALNSIGSGRLAIFNSGLTTLNGFENLLSVPGLRISGNPMLTSIEALNSLTTASGGIYIDENPALISLHGLENLTEIGQGENIAIINNVSLTSLAGIDNIIFDPLYLYNIHISGNTQLSECEVESFCTLFDQYSSWIVENNASGCNSSSEIEEACASSVNEISAINALSVTPTHFTTSTTISYELKQSETVQLSVYNQLGQLVYQLSVEQQQGSQQLQWDAQNQSEGLYYYQLKAGDQFASGKMVKCR